MRHIELARNGTEAADEAYDTADHDDQARLYLALAALHRLEWLGPGLKNPRDFRMEQGADFTTIMRSPR